MLGEVNGNVWTIPAGPDKEPARASGRVERRGAGVIAEAMPLARGGLVFASRGGGRGSGDGLGRRRNTCAIAAWPRARMGFASSFRTWCAEAAGVEREVAEAALGHVVDGSSEVERAYRRTDFLEQRQVLAERWADHVVGRGGGDVVRLVEAAP